MCFIKQNRRHKTKGDRAYPSGEMEGEAGQPDTLVQELKITNTKKFHKQD